MEGQAFSTLMGMAALTLPAPDECPRIRLVGKYLVQSGLTPSLAPGSGDARDGLGNYFRFYNFYNTERTYQTHGYRTPAEVFTSTPVEATSTGMVESSTPEPLRIAVPTLNIAPILS